MAASMMIDSTHILSCVDSISPLSELFHAYEPKYLYWMFPMRLHIFSLMKARTYLQLLKCVIEYSKVGHSAPWLECVWLLVTRRLREMMQILTSWLLVIFSSTGLISVGDLTSMLLMQAFSITMMNYTDLFCLLALKTNFFTWVNAIKIISLSVVVT